MRIRVVAIQLNSGDDKLANIAAVVELVPRAAEAGAQVVVLPELWTYLGPERHHREQAEPIPGALTERLGRLAREHRLILHAGSMLEVASADEGGHLYNTALLFDRGGHLVTRYRKLHLFDTDPVPGATPYRESATVTAGREIVLAEVEGLRLGLATCYDLRFPELFRALALRGAEIILLPSAFTLETGRDHWEVLVRARAIENGCYVVAPNQWGSRTDGRVTFGHSMIVDPWGTVIAQAADGVGMTMAELDLDRVRQTRECLPVLANRRTDVYG
jgi:predicted amidohydrolase